MEEKKTRRVVVLYEPSAYAEVVKRAKMMGMPVGSYIRLAERLTSVSESTYAAGASKVGKRMEVGNE